MKKLNSHSQSSCRKTKGHEQTFEVLIALPLKWLTETAIWVKQRPLTQEELQALEQLAWEHLNAHHIEESTSPGILQY